MRKRKVPSVTEEEESVQNHSHNQNENEGSEGNGFFACYLLTSLSPRYKGHTYIGFTVNPRRRIRQHNGEIGCGAWRTKKRRPWEMVLCIYGFPTNVSALQFEWAWQHPVESLAVRKAAVEFKSLSGLSNKIKLAYTMLTLPSWQSMNLTVNFFSTKYMKHCVSCPSLPVHMKTKIGSMDELPCYGESFDDDDNIDGVEFDNNASTSGSVPDVGNNFVTPDSPKNPNHGDKISEAFEWHKESEAREPPGHSFALQVPSQSVSSTTPLTMKSSSETSLQRVEIIEDAEFMGVTSKSGADKSGNSFTSQEQRQPFSSTTPLTVKPSSATSLQRVEIIEDTYFMGMTSKSGADLAQPESEQSDARLAANKNQDVSSTFVAPHEAEIIDLSTPSPSCRNILDRKKRRVSSSVGTDFIDLTNSPNFVQL